MKAAVLYAIMLLQSLGFIGYLLFVEEERVVF